MIKTRRAEKTDLKDFAILRFEAQKFASQFDKDILISKDSLKEILKLTENEFKDPRISYFVAREGDKIVGIAILSVPKEMGKSAYLGELFVEESHRGRGIGKLLVENAVEIARKNGLKKFQLTVAKGNKIGINFYKSLSFVSKRRAYILLEKVL